MLRELTYELTFSMVVIFDHCSVHIFNLSGPWALPIDMYDEDVLMNSLIVFWVRNGKIGLNPSLPIPSSELPVGEMLLSFPGSVILSPQHV